MRTAVLCALLVACGAEEAEAPLAPSSVETESGMYVLELTPSADPWLAGEAVSLEIEVRADGEPTADAALVVTPTMPAMGHGVEQDPVVEALGDGRFTASWTYSMAGYWELELDVTAAQGQDVAVVGYEVQ